jgi:transcription elongation factor Elf1
LELPYDLVSIHVDVPIDCPRCNAIVSGTCTHYAFEAVAKCGTCGQEVVMDYDDSSHIDE